MKKSAIAFLMQCILIVLMLSGVQLTHAKPSGMASWYGKYHHGRLTASGERFNMYGLTAAHKSLPFGTVLLVKNKETGESVRVKINDRGPYARGRVLDLSYGAAKRLGIHRLGVAKIEYRVLTRGGQSKPTDTRTGKKLTAMTSNPVIPTTVDSIENLIAKIETNKKFLAMTR